jgi:dTDP-glucose 4,6-dehydratase
VRHLTLTYPEAYNIISFDKIDYCASLNNTKCLDTSPNFSFVFGDINDQAAVLRCIRQYNIDTIMHFAAMSHVDLSFGNSFAFTETNVVGTHKLLEAAVKCNIKKFIHVSTDEVNGEHDGDDLKEDSLLKPTNPYAASKAAAEMYVEAYQKSYKLPCIIVRSNNVYGPHQYPESKLDLWCLRALLTSPEIIPKFSCLLDRGRTLMLHGSGKNCRRYLFGADAADAFDTILHKGVVGEIYNVDSCDEATNIEIAHRMLKEFGIPESDIPKWIMHTQDRPFNDHRYAVNADKLRGLGWRQKVRLEQGLPLTVDWYRRFGRGWWKGVEGLFDSAFPEVGGEGVVANGGSRTPLIEVQQEKLIEAAVATKEEKSNGYLAAPVNGTPAPLTASAPAAMNTSAGLSVATNGVKKPQQQRTIDSESKENMQVAVEELGHEVV